MADGFTITKFRDVADGLQAGQFAVGERRKASSLDDLDPVHRDLLDRPITVSLGVMTPDGRIGLTPMWFDYEGDKILVNTASHRSKCGWIRANPEMTVLIVNPDNPYHWVQIRCTVEEELREWEEGGERVTRQLDKTLMVSAEPPRSMKLVFGCRFCAACGVESLAGWVWWRRRRVSVVLSVM